MAGDVVAMARACREAAEAVIRRHQKLASLDLYRVLTQSLELCEAALATNSGQDELRQLVAADAETGRRRYVERGSDVYTTACRFVFSGDECHANMCRYAHALREASRLGLTSATLFEHLKSEGGVNALYLRRPLSALTKTLKIVQLDRSITVPKSGRFTLTLERAPNNVFAVIEGPQEMRDARP